MPAGSGHDSALPAATLQSIAAGTSAPTCATHARTVTPCRPASQRFAITPAATRIVVSRAELRPPPRGSRTPYLCR